MKFRTVSVPVFVLPIVLALSISLSPGTLLAQSEEADTPQTLSEQFQELKDKSNNYNEYKVVKAYKLNEFWKNVSDTLSGYQADIKLARNEINLLKDEISNLKESLSNTQEQLSQSEAINDSISFIGINISKSVYNIIVWGIILGLIILAVSLYSFYKRSHRVTRNAKKEYDTVSGEFEDYKKRAQEKQIKLKRELQTEINRVEELLNKYERNGVHSR